MDYTTRNKIVAQLLGHCQRELDRKGPDYAGDTDCLMAFKNVSARTGLSKYHVWLIYFLKHVDTLTNAIKKSPLTPWGVLKSESIEGRIIDAINYLVLLLCLIEEVRPELPLSECGTQDE